MNNFEFCLKIIVILSVVTSVVVVAQSDYCLLEDEYCKTKHIGCPRNFEEFEVYSQNWTNLRSGKLKRHQILYILTELNTVKNEIANGGYGFPKGARFSKIEWSDEFQYLAEKIAVKLPFNFSVCTLTESTSASYTIYYEEQSSNETTIEVFLETAVIEVIKKITEPDLVWMANYFSESVRVGCGYANYDIMMRIEPDELIDAESTTTQNTENEIMEFIHVNKFLCILDTIAEDRQRYEEGEPCSGCDEIGKVCGMWYTNLCA